VAWRWRRDKYSGSAANAQAAVISLCALFLFSRNAFTGLPEAVCKTAIGDEKPTSLFAATKNYLLDLKRQVCLMVVGGFTFMLAGRKFMLKQIAFWLSKDKFRFSRVNVQVFNDVFLLKTGGF
jgi:hypothetical protein